MREDRCVIRANLSLTRQYDAHRERGTGGDSSETSKIATNLKSTTIAKRKIEENNRRSVCSASLRAKTTYLGFLYCDQIKLVSLDMNSGGKIFGTV